MRYLSGTTPLPAICAFLAVLISVVALPAVTQASDEEIGAEVAKQVEEEIGIYEMPGTSDYVEAIGLRLVSRDEEPSAYGARFVERLRAEHHSEPLESRSVESDEWGLGINRRPSRVLSWRA
jgi:hypothetical protein